jgi:competence protein ComEA
MTTGVITKSMRVLISLTFTCVLFHAIPGSAQGQLPDAPGKDVTVRVCSQCHEPQRAASVRLTRDAWEAVLEKMVGLGMRASDDDLKQILEYLSENLKGEAPKPINMNSATPVELESVAALLRKEAAAWIAYRNKNGPCKTLDDLKKVPGVPFKKIDERRDRLVCF